MNPGPCLSILVWSEDHAPDSYDTVRSLAKKMLTLVDPDCRTNRVEFEHLQTAEARALKGAIWKSGSHRDLPKLVGLRRAIASKLLESTADVAGFVFFHIDGDTSWKERDASEQPEKFASLASAVERLVVEELERRGQRAAVATVMSRFRVLMPFHSIEAWLFQNTAELTRVCRASCGRHLTLIQDWAKSRGDLDELAGSEQPKKQVDCVRSADRLALASTAYPAQAVYDAGKSYAAAVEDLRRCPDLGAALARTYSG